MRRSLPRALLGIAISIAALALVASTTDLAGVWQALRAASVAWIALLLLTSCLDLTCRTFRWQAILAPIKLIRLPSVLAYELVGYLGNNALPARLGELVRVQVAGDREGISRAMVLGTVIAERLVDTAVLAIVASLAVVLLGITGPVATAMLAGLLSVLLLVGAVLVAVATQGAQAVGAIARRLPIVSNGAIASRVAGLAARVRAGVTVLGKRRTFGLALGWTAAAWLATIAGFMVAATAVDVHLSWSQAALLASGVALSTAIPAGPGYIGTFELAGVQICQAMGIDPTHGLAITVLAHASALGVTSLGGTLALVALASRPRVEAALRP